MASLPLSHFRKLAPPFKSRYLKVKWLSDENYKETEPVMQTFELPLAAFPVKSVREIRLRFDKTAAGTILLDDVGFSE